MFSFLNTHALLQSGKNEFDTEPSPESFQQGLHIPKLDKLKWFIVFHATNTGEAWSFVWGDKPTTASVATGLGWYA